MTYEIILKAGDGRFICSAPFKTQAPQSVVARIVAAIAKEMANVKAD